MSMWPNRQARPPAEPVIRPRPQMPRAEPMAAVLARASSPTDAERALKEVISAMAADAKRAGVEARAECDRLDGVLDQLEGRLYRWVEDYVERVMTVRKMYDLAREKAVVAQQALMAAEAFKPSQEAEVAPDHEAPVMDDEAMTNLASEIGREKGE